MPIYDYKCNQCGTTSEILHKSMDIKAVNCPSCDSTDLNKLISIPGAVIAKGSSFSSPLKTNVPPVCPNQNMCGMPTCPAANLK